MQPAEAARRGMQQGTAAALSDAGIVCPASHISCPAASTCASSSPSVRGQSRLGETRCSASAAARQVRGGPHAAGARSGWRRCCGWRPTRGPCTRTASGSGRRSSWRWRWTSRASASPSTPTARSSPAAIKTHTHARVALDARREAGSRPRAASLDGAGRGLAGLSSTRMWRSPLGHGRDCLGGGASGSESPTSSEKDAVSCG